MNRDELCSLICAICATVRATLADPIVRPKMCFGLFFAETEFQAKGFSCRRRAEAMPI